MNNEKRTQIYQRLSERNPSPTTELRFASPFELLIAVMLSAQATDTSVNKATEKLFAAANTPEAMIALGLASVTNMVKSIGLYKTKAANALKTCEILVKQHDGEVPSDRQALESLPGVGRKTANVVLNTAFGEPTIAVDTHIFRVANRTRIAQGKTVLDVEKKLLRRTPQQYLINAHHWLLLHGRYICKARTPNCAACFISDLCEFKRKNDV
jgi:endonuclease-3